MFNPEKLAENISLLLQQNKNVLLVGPSDSGKTWFVEHTLMPLFKKQGKVVAFYRNCDVLENNITADFVIVDEVELLQDYDFLQKLHPEDTPYYTSEYLALVAKWQKKLTTLTIPGLFIVSRERVAIPYVLEKVHTLEWNNSPCKVIEFTREE